MLSDLLPLSSLDLNNSVRYFHIMVFFAKRNISVLFFVVIITTLALTTYERNRVWRNEYTLWSDTVNKSPNKAMPHVNLGNAFVRRSLLDDAEKEFKLALEINPRDIRAINGLAVIYVKQKNYDEAIRLLEILTADKPDQAPFHNNLGVVYMEKGVLDEAIENFNTAIKADPDFADAYSNLGLAYKMKGLLNEARQEFEKALQLSPEHNDAKRELNEVMKQLKRS